MPRSKHTPQDKAAIVSEWRTSRVDQAAFAAQHGIVPRTLRTWLRQFPASPRERTPSDLLPALDQMIEELSRLRAVVAATAGASAPVQPQPVPFPPVRPGIIDLSNLR